MSPSEFDLRSALHHGEGDQPDVDLVLSSARRTQSARRRRLLTGAASVAIVVGLGTAGAVVATSGDGPRTDAGGAAGAVTSDGRMKVERSTAANGASTSSRAAAAPHPAAAPTERSEAKASAGANSDSDAGGGPTCPTTAPQVRTPRGPGTATALFAEPVASLQVCSYPYSGTPRLAGTVQLVGARATRLAASLEHASTTPAARTCPRQRPANLRRLVIIPRTASGTVLPWVVANLGEACTSTATNGIALRYAWAPPGDLARLLLQDAPQHGTPIR